MIMENSQNSRSTQELLHWYESTAGKWLSYQESRMLQNALPGLFGYHVVSAGLASPDDALSTSPIRHRIAISPSGKDSGLALVEADLMDLPFQNDAVDVMVLSHVLEYSLQPHSILREAERVVRPDGHIAILAFNPLSFFGLGRVMMGFPLPGRKQHSLPWRGHYYGITRIRDWLQLLGFEVVRSSYCAFIPPVQHEPSLRHLMFLERLGKRYFPLIGGVYLIVARNLVVTPAVIKPRWRPKKALIESGAIEPTNSVK
jgi:SAM-dependent methyltransferase